MNTTWTASTTGRSQAVEADRDPVPDHQRHEHERSDGKVDQADNDAENGKISRGK